MGRRGLLLDMVAKNSDSFGGGAWKCNYLNLDPQGVDNIQKIQKMFVSSEFLRGVIANPRGKLTRLWRLSLFLLHEWDKTSVICDTKL